MSRISIFRGLLLNLEQKVPESRRRLYLSKEQALEALRRKTGQDFGENVAAWRAWLKSQGLYG